MPDRRLDVLAIGNAIVDVIADADDAFLVREGLTKGSMRLIDAEEATRLYAHMAPAREVSGGSAGNTAAGVAALGARAGFIGQVAPDQLGDFYIHDLRSTGVEFTTAPADFGVPTARSMVLVTPDGHRTMNTFLGAAQHLPASAWISSSLAKRMSTRPPSISWLKPSRWRSMQKLSDKVKATLRPALRATSIARTIA